MTRMGSLRALVPLAGLLPLLAFAAAPGCQSTAKGKTTVVEPAAMKPPPEFEKRESIQLVRRNERLVSEYEELRLQGKLRQAEAVRNTIGQSVDREFETFEEVALHGELTTYRTLAVNSIGFAAVRKKEAHDLLQRLLRDPAPIVVANAALGLAVLRHPETDWTRLIELCASGDPEVRINAASALKELFPLRETPRTLTPEHRAAVDRLVVLLVDEDRVRARRAAVYALANLHHPDMLPHLVAALKDEDGVVQVGALIGIGRLKDPRAIEPLLEYLDDDPEEAQASWAQRALCATVLEAGLSRSRAELEPLGTNVRRWRAFLEEARSR